MQTHRTFSVVVGSLACNARCPFCVARMTPTFGLSNKKSEIDWVAFERACRMAKNGNAETVMLTGNGEPTLFPQQITQYLSALAPFGFSNIELQTNGIPIAEGKLVGLSDLRQWRASGLNLIAISVAHFEAEKNRQIFLPHRKNYIDLPALIDTLNVIGFRVRLTCIMARGYIDSVEELQNFACFARQHSVEQLTFTPVNMSAESRDREALAWTMAHHLSVRQVSEIEVYLNRAGKLCKVMPHGAKVFNLDGQNICLSNCLTRDEEDSEQHRNLIFFPNGTLTTDWQDESKVVVQTEQSRP